MVYPLLGGHAQGASPDSRALLHYRAPVNILAIVAVSYAVAIASLAGSAIAKLTATYARWRVARCFTQLLLPSCMGILVKKKMEKKTGTQPPPPPSGLPPSCGQLSRPEQNKQGSTHMSLPPCGLHGTGQ